MNRLHRWLAYLAVFLALPALSACGQLPATQITPSQVILPTQAAPSPADACLSAKINSPAVDTPIHTKQVEIRWDRPSCQMDVQYYQEGKLIYDTKEHEGFVDSGYKLSIAKPGRTEIKIWAQGAGSVQTDSVWVLIANDAS